MSGRLPVIQISGGMEPALQPCVLSLQVTVDSVQTGVNTRHCIVDNTVVVFLDQPLALPGSAKN